MPKRRYCEMCDRWFPVKHVECPECGIPMQSHEYCAACDREGATAGADISGTHTCGARPVRKGRR